MDKKIIKYLDRLSDNELFFDLSLRFGVYLPIWKECSKEEYEKNVGTDDDSTIKILEKFLTCQGTYKREPHWNNMQAGILWQIEHYNDEPDYYTYHKLVDQEFTLMLGSEILNYLNNRKPYWYEQNRKNQSRDRKAARCNYGQEQQLRVTVRRRNLRRSFPY